MNGKALINPRPWFNRLTLLGFTGLMLMAGAQAQTGQDCSPAHGGSTATESSPCFKKSAMKIRFQFSGEAFTFILDSNPPAQELAAMLPLQLTVRDYASSEKIADLPRKLTVQGVPDGTDARAGDLAYYAPWGNLALFYKDASYARGLIRLGHVEGALNNLKKQGDDKVTIELVSD